MKNYEVLVKEMDTNKRDYRDEVAGWIGAEDLRSAVVKVNAHIRSKPFASPEKEELRSRDEISKEGLIDCYKCANCYDVGIYAHYKDGTQVFQHTEHTCNVEGNVLDKGFRAYCKDYVSLNVERAKLLERVEQLKAARIEFNSCPEIEAVNRCIQNQIAQLYDKLKLMGENE
jgi:hypothetical protein